MRNLDLLISFIVYILVLGGGIWCCEAFADGEGELYSFLAAALAGTITAVWGYFRHNGYPILQAEKTVLGLVLAGSALAAGLVLHFGFRWFERPEVSLPVLAIGTFILPVILFAPLGKIFARKSK